VSRFLIRGERSEQFAHSPRAQRAIRPFAASEASHSPIRRERSEQFAA
jgi:hypothetical protein